MKTPIRALGRAGWRGALLFKALLIMTACGGSGSNPGAIAVSSPAPATTTPVTLTVNFGTNYGCVLDQAHNNSGYRVLCWNGFTNSTNPISIVEGITNDQVEFMEPMGVNFCVTALTNVSCFGPLPSGMPSGTCSNSNLYSYPSVQPTFCGDTAKTWIQTTSAYHLLAQDSECTELANVVTCSDESWTTGITYQFGIN